MKSGPTIQPNKIGALVTELNMAEPKYLDSLRDEIAVVDRKIDDFNEKFDQKFDTLSENLHKVEVALEKVSTKLEEFIPRVDKFLDRVIGLEKVGTKLEESVTRHDEFIGRAWHLFAASLLLLLGSIATVGGSIAISLWQAQQHGKQIEKLERSVDRLDKSVAGLEKSVEKIPSLETSIVRLDHSVAGLEKSLEQHGKQLDKLEKSVEKIAGLETAIVRLEASVTRFAGLEKSLADLPALARSMDEFLNERRRELRLAAGVQRLRFSLDEEYRKRAANDETQLKFEWELTAQQAVEIELGRTAAVILPAYEAARMVAEVFRGDRGPAVRLTIEFPSQKSKDLAQSKLVGHGREVEILVPARPKP
jgi:septal ring factor EnvC (AmiA/AmiB activator)